MRPPRGKKKLFDAALKLFAAQGYFATTVDQIWAEAGVSKGLVYNYFSSKEELVVALLKDETERMAGVAVKLSDGGPLEESMSAFVEDYLRFLKAERQSLRLQLSLLIMPELRGSVAAPLQTRAAMLLSTVHGWFRRAGVEQAKSKARVFLAMLDGVALHYLVVFDRYPLRTVKQQLIRSALDLCADR